MPLIQAVGFNIGLEITAADPDLQVLAGQVPSIPNMVLILTVAVGVGFFLVLALVRMLFGIQLSHMLLVSVIFQGRTAEPRKHCALPERKTFK